MKHRQQLAIVINDEKETVGVLSMEDVIEHIIGEEIFEDDDPAIDMRELARLKDTQSKKRLRPMFNYFLIINSILGHKP